MPEARGRERLARAALALLVALVLAATLVYGVFRFY